jgi:hypothetical protein
LQKDGFPTNGDRIFEGLCSFAVNYGYPGSEVRDFKLPWMEHGQMLTIISVQLNQACLLVHSSAVTFLVSLSSFFHLISLKTG